MDDLYKLFDRFTEMIPPQLLPVIRLAAILVWVLMAGIVAILAWRQGSESAPQMGQELSLAEIKARQQREANLKKPPAVRVPDLNELLPEPALDSSIEEAQDRRESAFTDGSEDPRLLETREDLMRAENPVAEPAPRYAGEGLAPVNDDRPGLLPTGPQDYRPTQTQATPQEPRPLPQSTELLPLDARGDRAEPPTAERRSAPPATNSSPNPAPAQAQPPARRQSPGSASELPLLD